MKLTVILCTYNRCNSLAQALESVTNSTLPESIDWEVLVVDNNSSDQTKAVIERFCHQHPARFRYLYEPRQGKPNALNSGIREARGDVLAFLDDDVVVEKNWLRNLTGPLFSGQWAGVAGRILPDPSFKLPPWAPLHDRYALAPLAIFDPNVPAGPISEPPFGANMAYKKSMFQKYGGFRTDLGPQMFTGLSPKSEDSEFGHRLLEAGEKLRYEPSAVVYHAVPPNRQRKEYFLEWWYDKARADICAFGIPTDTTWYLAGAPLYLFRRFLVWTIRWMIATAPAQRFGAKIKVWAIVAQIKECHRLSQARLRSATTPSSD
jgi:glucosyl-dolichyl phosphate glucuronosyltransferase